MNYKLFIYTFSILVSVFVVSGMNINSLFKKNRLWEERIFVIMLAIILGYLVSSFIISFIEVSKIV